jgi:hypothetical protein
MNSNSPRVLLTFALTFVLTAFSPGAPSARPTPLHVTGNKSGFALLPATDTGITFQNELDELTGARNRTLHNGSGVAIGDCTGDGLPDLYFCSLSGKNALYKNLGGFKFIDIAAEAGVEGTGDISRGATFADLDGDGDLDLLVGTSGAGVRTFLNDGHGRFRDFTKEAGTASRYASVTLALADVEGDGDLDLYVCNNRVEDFRDRGQVNLLKVDGKLKVPAFLQDRFVLGPNDAIQEYGEPDQLYLNDGAAHFTPVSWTGGAFLDEDGKPLSGPPRDWGLTATFRDMNGDGAPDLYVCNDYWTPDRIWIGDGRGKFRAADRLAFRNTSASSMGVDFADVDRDGHIDCFVVDMLSRDHQRRKMQMGAMKPTPIEIGLIDNRPQIMRNTLQMNRGDGTFAETAYFAGLAASEWSWQPLFLDVDLDGFEDVLISTGHVRDVQDADTSRKIDALRKEGTLVPAGPAQSLGLGGPDRQSQFTAELLAMAQLRPRLDTPVVAFRNLGDGRFEPADEQWGTNQNAVHHGIASGDLDGDGDLDFVVNNLGSVASVYRNDGGAGRVAVRLRGAKGNVQGIGARVTLVGGAVPKQQQELVSGGRYTSGCEPLLVFAPGKTPGKMQLEVTWRSGKVTIVENVEANQLLEIDEAGAQTVPPAPPAAPKPMFVDASAKLNHTHHENEFDDFARQILLPNRFSQMGPAVAWCDLNGDGLDDLLIGTGRDGKPGKFLNDGKGGFTPQPLAPVPADTAAIVGWSEKAGEPLVTVGLSTFENDATHSAAVAVLHSNADLTGGKKLPANSATAGAISAADVNGDGALDLFVAGRTVPGRYPEPASSRLFLRQADGFVEDTKTNALLKNIGLVSASLFSDLNGDGAQDLVLAREWGPITVWLNDGRGGFTDATEKLGLARFTGWWNGVTAGDLDGDGRMDLVATNWGRNSKYEHHYDEKHPLLIYWGDFNGDGVVQAIESHYDHHLGKLVPERGLSCSSTAMPFIKTITPTYTTFGAAGLDDIYRGKLKDAPRLSANTLDHMVFLNRGDRFEGKPLPTAAQLAPGFGVNVADFDGDGNEDVFLAQNFFAAQIETPRCDAGRGLWLRGDGKGGLTPVDGAASGVKVWGDARGSAVGDYDGDGRVDLVVGQNGASTKLFRNTSAKPGLRVRLTGPAGNLTSLGAQVALRFGESRGPTRELHGGSGFWSQDSAVQVFGTPTTPTQVWVRWPGGKETTAAIPAGAREITVSATGDLKVAAMATR